MRMPHHTGGVQSLGAPAAPSSSPQAAHSGRLVRVDLVSGSTVQVQSREEAEWFNTTRERYLDEMRFTEATDLRDLDRLLMLELLVFRWTLFLSSGVDYEGHLVTEETLQRDLKNTSDQITKLKTSMGLAKAQRDAAENDGNFAQWLANLKERAKIFGVHRETQLTKALALINELDAVVGAFDRADAEERVKIGFESEAEIVAWIREQMLPQFRVVDEYFQHHEQRYWVREL